MLQLSERHLLRLKKAYREEGPGALAHGNRGRKPAHAVPASTAEEIVRVARKDYPDYNHSHLHEELVAEHGVSLSRRTVARILTRAGVRSPRRRRPRRHRSRRERMPQEGMMLQVDGSRHDWLEGRGPPLTLVGAVDDATGDIPSALFREQEDAQGYLMLLRESVRNRGVPVAWYSDRHGIFQRNDKEPWTLAEELAGRREPTQLARALEQLGITLITASSPQAKGRVERCWGTLQDRLVKELRRAGARTREEANHVLSAYLPRYRQRFARSAADPHPAYRPMPRGLDLDALCSFHYVRTVANDNTVRLEERLVQIPPGPRRRSYAGCKVQLQERLDGSLVVLHQSKIIARQDRQSDAPIAARRRKRGRELPLAELKLQATRQLHQAATPRAPGANGKPAPDHPWRTSIVTKSLAS